MYKVLDVREYNKIGKAYWYKGYCGNGGELSISQHLRFVVIAEEVETMQRVRFEFFDAYVFEFGGKEHFGGYLGDFSLLVPGDYFLIQDTEAQKKVVICNS